jgi:lipopolysaccharide/colanic/teichoic acid biosynthesis glycosyltransferase
MTCAESTPPGSAVPAVRVSEWTQSVSKRIFDLVLVVPMTLAALPLMIGVAVAIRVSSKGPILFRQKRCGRWGDGFELVKFRTMKHDESSATGPNLTRKGDQRITRVGRFLRKWKLDELPQLFNVLRGEMSLVGPRPDMPEYMAELKAGQRGILSLHPGITGWATLQFRHEEQLLATVPGCELREFYIRSVLPNKVQLDLEYGERATMWSDFVVLLKTIHSVLK